VEYEHIIMCSRIRVEYEHKIIYSEHIQSTSSKTCDPEYINGHIAVHVIQNTCGIVCIPEYSAIWKLTESGLNRNKIATK
jgi:hypothetical protein